MIKINFEDFESKCPVCGSRSYSLVEDTGTYFILECLNCNEIIYVALPCV